MTNKRKQIYMGTCYKCCIVYFFIWLIKKVSLEVTVQYFVGESAILPCSYTEDINQVDKVFWIHNDSEKVYEYISRGSQELKYNKRVSSFHNEFANGNYSIKIKKLEKNDTGVYSCLIIPADHFENVYLIIKAKEDPSLKVNEEENQSTQTNRWIIPVAVVCLISFGVFFILYTKFPQLFMSQ